jgi:hypothetical protein
VRELHWLKWVVGIELREGFNQAAQTRFFDLLGLRMEGHMRLLMSLAVVFIILAIGYGVRSNVVPSSTPDLATRAMATSDTLWPHEIHINLKNMEKLPVHEVKQPF